MPYTVEHQPAENIIVARVWGKANLSVLQKLAKEIILVSRQSVCFCMLTDLREVELNVSTMDIYSLPGFIKETAQANDIDIFSVKRAFVMTESQKILQFYETISLNRSHHTKLFFDIEQAKKWLLES